MAAPRKSSKLPAVLAGLVFLVLVLAPAVAGAQQPPTFGATPEPAKEWTYYLSWLIAPLSIGLILLIGLSYMRLSSRFFAKEEPPKPSKRPRYPTGTVIPPVSAGPRVEQQGAASTTPPAAPAAEVQTAKEQEPKPVDSPERQAPAAEGTPAATAPAEASPGAPPRDEPAAEPKTAPEGEAPPAPAAAPAPAAPEHVEPDQEAYEKELQAQLDKGTERRVAEGRAKAAAIRAARAAASGAAPAPAQAPAEPEQTPEAKEPEVVEAPSPAEEAKKEEAEPSPKVEAPDPAPETSAEPSDAPRPAAPPGGDEETFNRVLEEQLGKGLARPIAESRARAAAIKAAREKSGG